LFSCSKKKRWNVRFTYNKILWFGRSYLFIPSLLSIISQWQSKVGTHAVTFLPHFCIILYIVELGFVSLSRICLKYLLFWRYVTINQSRQTNIRSVQTSIRRKERNALMLMLWKRQCVPKHTSTLEYHVSDASLLIYKSKYMCNLKLLFNDIWSSLIICNL
jgi:hypothetical protein